MSLHFGSYHFDRVLSLDDGLIGRDIQRILEEARALASKRECYEGVTIDGAHSKVLDGGFSVEHRGWGRRVGYHISDVAPLIKPGDPTYDYALRRGVTRYPVDGKSSIELMIPKAISEDGLSLMPNSLRPTIAIFFCYDLQGALLRIEPELSAFKNIAKLSYADAQEQIELTEAPFKSIMNGLFQSAINLQSLRLGKPITDSKNWKLLTESGEALSARQGEELAQFIVVEHSFAANRFAATTMSGCPILFRNTRAINEQLHDDLGELALISDSDISRAVSQCLLDIKKTRGKVLTNYSTVSLGHSGVQAKDYTHITAPLRRIADHPGHHNLHAAISSQQIEVDRASLNDAAVIATGSRNISRKEKKAKHKLFKLGQSGIEQLTGHEEPVVIALGFLEQSNASHDSLSAAIIQFASKKSGTNIIGETLFTAGAIQQLSELQKALLENLKKQGGSSYKAIRNSLYAYLEKNDRFVERIHQAFAEGFFGVILSIQIEGKIFTAEAVDPSLRDAERHACLRLAFVVAGQGDEIPILTPEATLRLKK
jgi:hypothetical protein